MTATKIHTIAQSFNARTFVRDLRSDPDLQGNAHISPYLGACLQAMISQELKQTDNSVARYKSAYETVKSTLKTARDTAGEYYLDGDLPDHVAYALCAISLGYSHHTLPPSPGPLPQTDDAMPHHPMGHTPIQAPHHPYDQVIRLFSEISGLDNRTPHILQLHDMSKHKKDMTTDPMFQNPDNIMVVAFDINYRLKQGIALAKSQPESFYRTPSDLVKSIVNASALSLACRWHDRSLTRENTNLARRLQASLDIQRPTALTNA